MKCKASFCDNERIDAKHGWCGGHKAQMLRYKFSEPKPLRVMSGNKGFNCIVEGCVSEAVSRNLCQFHKGQFHRGKSIDEMKPKLEKIRRDCATWWCEKTAVKSIVCGTCAARAREYNLEYEDYAKLPRTCEICGKGGRMHLDHDHDTGKFRGVLCQGCNTGIGQFYENTQIMQSAIAYLEFWKN
jgi:hypothetical protein